MKVKFDQLEKEHATALKIRKEKEEELETLTKKTVDSDKFHCDLIKGDCPYVQLIKEKSNLDERKIEKLKEQIGEISLEKDTKAVALLDDQREKFEGEIKNIRSLFEAVNWKQIQEVAVEYAKSQSQISLLSKQVEGYEQELENQATMKDKQTSLQATITAKKEQLEQITQKQQSSQEMLASYRKQVEELSLDNVVRVEK